VAPARVAPMAAPHVVTSSGAAGRTIGETFGGLSAASGVALLGALVIAAGSVGPWVDTILGSISGTRADGQLTLAAAAIAFVCTLLMASGKGGHFSSIAGLLSALGAGVVAVVDLSEIQSNVEGATVFGAQLATAGWGIYAVILGAIITFGGIVVADRARRSL